MPRGRPLEGAPGWRIVERPRRRRRWWAGYLIVPVAIAAASLQFLLWDHSPVGPALDGREGTDAADPVVGWNEQLVTPSPPAPRSPGGSGDREGQVTGATDPDPAIEIATGSAPAIRVFIHHAAGAENALRAMQLAAYLETHRFVVTDIRPVAFDIAEPSVRYFFEGDQAESGRLVEAIDAFFVGAPDRAPDRPADFSHFTPRPRQGNVEVWLSSPHRRENQSS